MTNEQLALGLTIASMAAGLIWLIIRLATRPLEQVVKNNTVAMERIYTILDRHEHELKEHGETIAVLDERTSRRHKP